MPRRCCRDFSRSRPGFRPRSQLSSKFPAFPRMNLIYVPQAGARPIPPSFPDRLTAPYFPRSHDRPRFGLASLASIGFHVSFRQVDPARFRRLCAFRATPFPLRRRQRCHVHIRIYLRLQGKTLCRVLSFSRCYRRFLISVLSFLFFLFFFKSAIYRCFLLCAYARSWVANFHAFVRNLKMQKCTEE